MQGDAERELGYHPDALFDREKDDLTPQSQKNFIGAFVSPFHAIVGSLFPKVAQVSRHIDENVAYWDELASSGLNFREKLQITIAQ